MLYEISPGLRGIPVDVTRIGKVNSPSISTVALKLSDGVFTFLTDPEIPQWTITYSDFQAHIRSFMVR